MSYLKIIVSLLVNTSAISLLYLVPTEPEFYTELRFSVSNAEKISNILVIPEKAKRLTDNCTAVFCGAYRIRTDDRLIANQVLYQLS